MKDIFENKISYIVLILCIVSLFSCVSTNNTEKTLVEVQEEEHTISQEQETVKTEEDNSKLAIVTEPATETEIAPEPIVEKEPEPVPEPEPEKAPELIVEPEFDPQNVSKELKDTTISDVRKLILELNTIIQRKDYNSWVQHLTKEYIEYYSSQEVLSSISNANVLKKHNIVLKTLKDYFNYVVYPSRQNDTVDDIEFIEPKRIKAIIVTSKNERLVLYNLEKIDDIWLISIWR